MAFNRLQLRLPKILIINTAATLTKMPSLILIQSKVLKLIQMHSIQKTQIKVLASKDKAATAVQVAPRQTDLKINSANNSTTNKQ